MGYGFEGHIGLGKETTWGSAAAITDYVEALSENVALTIERFTHKNIIGTLAEPDDTAGLRRVAGGITFAAHPVAVGYFLNSALSNFGATEVTSGILYSTLFKTGSGDFSSASPVVPYTFEIYRGVTSSQQYTGCVVNALNITFNSNGAVMCEAQMLGRGHTAAMSRSTPTFPGSPSKPFTFDTCSLSLGGAANVNIETLTIGINNNLEGISALNLTTDIAKVRRNNHQMVNVSGVLDFADNTEYLNFVNQTEQRLAVSVTKASSFKMVVDIPRMVYTTFPLAIPGKERLTIGFEGKGFYSTGSGTAIAVTLTTVKSNY
jgi:hypothetical protein